MSAVLEKSNEILIANPLPHQLPVDQSNANRKVLRWGRRAGKTRWAFKAAIVGHGEKGSHQRVVRNEVVEAWEGPRFRGVAHGRDVIWIGRDYKQARTLWTEEIEPRFHGKTHATVHQTEKRVELSSGGSLWIRSNENIESVRGAGAKLVGVIVDEAAWQDLESALKEVILPALLDLDGWLVLLSTTNAGRDGNAEGRVPSYFNQICHEIAKGQRSAEWQEFYATAFDNPKISPAAIDELIAEYREDSIELAQEVYAKLVRGGGKLAFPEFREDVHVQKFTVPSDWWWGGGMDWGYTSPGWIGLEAFGPDGRSHLAWEWEFQKLAPYEVGYQMGKKMLAMQRPHFIACDSQMWETGDGRGGTRVAVAEEVQRGLRDALGSAAPTLIAAPKGRGSRLARKMALHEGLKYSPTPDGKIPVWGMPKFTIDPSCERFIHCIGSLQLDPMKPEDVDTEGYDHPYDGETYLRVTRKPAVETPERPQHPDRHAGIRLVSDDDEDDGRRFVR